MNDYLKEYKQDSVIDRDLLDDGALRSSELHSKYLDYFLIVKKELAQSRSKKKLLVKTLTSYYSGTLNGTVKLEQIGREPFKQKLTKTGVATHVDGDVQVIRIDERIDILLADIECLVRILDEIKFRTQAIRAAIDDRKFKAGF